MNDDPTDNIFPATPDNPQGNQEEQAYVAGPSNTVSAAISEIDPEFEDKALEKIKAVFKGNGIKLANIKSEKFEGVTLQYLATTKLQLRIKTLERTEAGKKAGPVQVAGPAEVREEVTKQEHKITHRADTIKRIQTYIVEQREDMGYGLDGLMVKLPFLYIDYVQYEPCQNCKAQGTVMCQRCHGQGMEMCTKCEGQGLEVCIQCSGSQYIQDSNGNRQQCNRCFGRGKTSCGLCNERRKIQCRICRTKGSTQCGACNGHAWNSHIYTLEIDAMPSFDYDRENVEDRIGTIVDEMGSDLVNHADITPIFKENDEKDAEDKRDFIAIPYIVKLPYGDIQFSIGDGEIYNTLIFGKNCELKLMPFLLDRILKKPMARLKEASESRGNVAEKIQKAGKFKTIRQAILAAARMPNGKAALKVRALNPHAIQTKTIESMVEHADTALKNITQKPRQQGFIIGLIVCAGLYAAYLMAGIRGLITSPIANQYAEIAADILILGIGFYIAITCVKFMGRKAMMDALSGLVPSGKEGKFMPKAGKITDKLIIATPLLFFAMLEASVHINNSAPWWYMALRAKLGL